MILITDPIQIISCWIYDSGLYEKDKRGTCTNSDQDWR